jgi:predicted nucleic acid-binding protein
MKFLLDTCVISELVKKQPDKKVIRWISNIDENNVFLSVITIGEIYKGIEEMPSCSRKILLQTWVANDLTERFRNRILSFDRATASLWGTIQAQSEMAGKSMPIIDCQIVATGIHNKLTIATRNITDMEISDATFYDPWK